MTTDEILTKIVTLCRKHDATSVTLFGSRAKGTARHDSDIEIAVSRVNDLEELKEEIVLKNNLHRIIYDYTDVLEALTRTFEARAATPGSGYIS